MQRAKDQIEQHRKTLIQIEKVSRSIKELEDRRFNIEQDIRTLTGSSANSRPAKRQRGHDTSGLENASSLGSASKSKSKKRARSDASDTDSDDSDASDIEPDNSDERVECGTAGRGGAAKDKREKKERSTRCEKCKKAHKGVKYCIDMRHAADSSGGSSMKHSKQVD